MLLLLDVFVLANLRSGHIFLNDHLFILLTGIFTTGIPSQPTMAWLVYRRSSPWDPPDRLEKLPGTPLKTPPHVLSLEPIGARGDPFRRMGYPIRARAGGSDSILRPIGFAELILWPDSAPWEPDTCSFPSPTLPKPSTLNAQAASSPTSRAFSGVLSKWLRPHSSMGTAGMAVRGDAFILSGFQKGGTCLHLCSTVPARSSV